MDDCDVPVDVVVAHITSATSAIADNFAVANDGSIMLAGNAEMSDAEEEEAVLPTVLGRGQLGRNSTVDGDTQPNPHALVFPMIADGAACSTCFGTPCACLPAPLRLVLACSSALACSGAYTCIQAGLHPYIGTAECVKRTGGPWFSGATRPKLRIITRNAAAPSEPGNTETVAKSSRVVPIFVT
ncbi:hypothetical protein C8J57DRAFT_1254489 [Mycena rebaudengoi]|nr:hypothetical protein C8J57DRAFT_1254489 [Mycena rebaudengoi]